MFDFQRLKVYQKAKKPVHAITDLIRKKKFDRITSDQLRRASFSILLNIAESASRFSEKDRKNFLIIARGSAFECLAILEFLKEEDRIDEATYKSLYEGLEEVSRMLFAMIGNLKTQK